MKKSRFTESQVVAILQEEEAGVPVAQLARKHGISPATYHHWKSKYAGAGVPELKRLRELEAENAKLKRMYFNAKGRSDVMDTRRLTTQQVLSAYEGHPLSQASIRERLGRTLPESIHPTELDLAIDPEGEITDQNHVGGALSTLQLASLAAVQSDNRILDLGCGLGGPARLVALIFRCRIYGIDANCQRIADAIALTNMVGLSNLVQFRCADIATLAPDREFDVVWVQNTWQHIGQPALLASMAIHALKCGGRLAFEEVFIKRAPNNATEKVLLEELCDVWQCNLLPLSEWIKAFETAGLTINAIEQADTLFLDYFARSIAIGSVKRADWPEHELRGHHNALALGKAGVISYGRVIAERL